MRKKIEIDIDPQGRIEDFCFGVLFFPGEGGGGGRQTKINK